LDSQQTTLSHQIALFRVSLHFTPPGEISVICAASMVVTVLDPKSLISAWVGAMSGQHMPLRRSSGQFFCLPADSRIDDQGLDIECSALC